MASAAVPRTNTSIPSPNTRRDHVSQPIAVNLLPTEVFIDPGVLAR